MKNKNLFKRLMIFGLFTVIVLMTINTCKKDNVSNVNSNKESKQVQQNVVAAVGATLTTSDSLKLVIPPNALPNDGTVFLGRTGTEPTSVPNTNLRIVGNPITIQIPSDSIVKPILISFPIISTSISTDNYFIFLYNGSTYFPVSYTLNGNIVTVTIDIINWETNYNKMTKQSLLNKIIISAVENIQMPPPSSQMGLKEVIMQSGEMTFSDPQTINSSSKILLLVHGWINAPTVWKTLIGRLQNETNPSYTNYWTFGYNTALSINVNGELLYNSLLHYDKGAQIDLVAHSMGGLVSRSMIEQWSGATFINKLITLGTPHQGTPKAAFRNILGLIVSLNSFSSLFDLSDIYIYYSDTQGVEDLYENSQFINLMMTMPGNPLHYPYYTIAATNNPSWFGNLFFGGLNDGLVSVVSAEGVPGGGTCPTTLINIPVDDAHNALPSNLQIYGQILGYLKVLIPSVSTNTITNITSTTATSGGNVTSDGGSPVTARGVCWSTSANPTISDAKTEDGSGLGNFPSSITNLTPGVNYYVRAYATNSAGTAYGNELSLNGLTVDINNILPQSALDSIRNMGMPINTGYSPPMLNGIYDVSPFVLLSTNVVNDYPIGHQFADYRIQFYNEDAIKQTIQFSYIMGNESGTGIGSFIAGSGNEFTIFAQENSTIQGYPSIGDVIISGSIGATGINNFYQSIYMVQNYGMNSIFIKNGSIRVSYDQDGLSGQVSSLKAAKINNLSGGSILAPRR